MKKTGLFITSLVLIIIVLSVVQVVVSNRLSTTGIELSSLQNDLKTYKKENSILSEKILIASSFVNIDAIAKDSGFVKNKSVLFVSTPLPIALRP